MRNLVLTVLAFSLVFLGAVYAVTAFAADGSIPITSFIDPFRPYVMEVASIAIAGLVGWAARRVHQLTGLNIEARHREALQSALENGARLVIERIGRSAAGKSVPVGNAILEDGVEYVLRSVPDAVRFFGLTPQRLGELLRPKLVPLL